LTLTVLNVEHFSAVQVVDALFTESENGSLFRGQLLLRVSQQSEIMPHNPLPCTWA